MKLRILIKTDSDSSVIELDRSFVLIGRKAANLTLSDPRCSHQHALLFESFLGTLRIKDLESTNGTYLGKEKVQEAEVAIGDDIRIGRTHLTVLDFIPATEAEVTNTKKKLSEKPKKSGDTGSATIKEPGVVISWPDNILAMPKDVQGKFVDYVDEKGQHQSVSLDEMLKKASKK
ncbi:MAG: FHA domain-containing protein [Deltaproteobacteria bacterium]|nr:FHA domain-containing protein [Deltaproteobacteria bacterium]